MKTVGIGLLDRRYGPFSLKIGWIKAISDDEALRYLQERRERYEIWKQNNPQAAAEEQKLIEKREFEKKTREETMDL